MLLTAAGLGGCGAGTWLGEREDPPLPGTRVPVMLLTDSPEPDPRLANLRVELPPPVRNEAWPQNGGAPSHALHHVAAGADLRPAWRGSVGSGASGVGRLLSTPIVAAGKVFAVDGEGTVTALAAADGRRLWRQSATGPERDARLQGGGLAFADGWLFIVRSHGTVTALNADNGAPVWDRALRAPIRSAPTIAGRRLLVRTADNQLYALDPTTGEIVWRHAGIFEQAGILGGASPAVEGDVVVVAYSSGEVFALTLDTGRSIWSDTVARPRRTLAIGTITDITGSPVIDRDRVYVTGTGGEMAAIQLARGDRIWDIAVTSLHTPWVAGEFVYVVTERGELVCLLRQGGRIRWVSPLARVDGEGAAAPGTLWAGPVLAGDRLLVVSNRGDIASVSPYTGEILGRVATGASLYLPPIVADGTLYVLTDDADLLAYR